MELRSLHAGPMYPCHSHIRSLLLSQEQAFSAIQIYGILYIPDDGSGPMSDFEWDAAKNRVNRAKHGVGFELAQHAFLDPLRVIAEDIDHGGGEQRYFCFGRIGAP